MSNTMSASGTQAPEPKPGLSDPPPATSPLKKIYCVNNQSGVSWDPVKIEHDERRDVWTITATGTPPFSGTAELVLAPFQRVQFASDEHPEKEFVYASWCDDMVTLTYILYKKGDHQDPPDTGIWLGTSSGGQVCPPAKA